MGLLSALVFVACVACMAMANPLQSKDVDHPGNEDVQLKDRDYGFLNSGAYNSGGSTSGGLWDRKRFADKFNMLGNKRNDVDHPGNEERHLQDRDYGFLNAGAYTHNTGSSSGGLWDDSWPLKRALAKYLKDARKKDVDHPGNEDVQLKDRDYGFLNSGSYNSGGSTSGGLWDRKRFADKFNMLGNKRNDVDHPGNEERHLQDRDYGFLNSGAYSSNTGSSSGGLWDDSWPLKRALANYLKLRSQTGTDGDKDIGRRDYVDIIWGSPSDHQPSDPWGSSPWGTGDGGGIWGDRKRK